jgi:hypothetical protein
VALKAVGAVVAWGYPYDGEATPPSPLTNVVAIAAGDCGWHSLALVGDGPPVLGMPLSTPSSSPNSFSVSLPTQSGHVYRLEYKTSLADSTWTPLPLVAGSGGTLTLTDPTAGASQRFYRARQW